MARQNRSSAPRRAGVSPQTDELASTLLGRALDCLAVGEPLEVLLAVQDAAGTIAPYEFGGDGPEECLAAARRRVGELARQSGDPAAGLAAPVRYAIAYEGAVADDDGTYLDAVLLEFGERGYEAFSAYSLVDGKGDEDAFRWTDPAPAGQMEPLL